MDSSLISPQVLLIALAAGILPSLLWLWFWLREDRLHPEPKTMIALAFVGGMTATLISYPIERGIAGYLANTDTDQLVAVGTALLAHSVNVQDIQFVLWVAVEEVLKYAALVLLVLRSPYFDEPIDAVIYMITIAIGFSGLENALFLLSPISDGDMVKAANLGELRIIGATLLHITSSAILGITMALTYFRPHAHRIFWSVIGLMGAIAFHSTYNLSLIHADGPNPDLSSIFIGLWVAALGVLVACERIRKMPDASHVMDPNPMNIERLNHQAQNTTNNIPQNVT